MDDARAWARWWRLDGLPQMRSLLWELWDPLALAGVAPDDEYDSYAAVLASKLRRRNSVDDIAAYLTTTLASEDDLLSPEWRAQCERTAHALVEWYGRSAAPP